MDRNGIIQVLLARTHLERDGEALDDFVAAEPDDMDTDDALVLARHNELVNGGFLLLIGNLREVERTEG